MKKPKKILFINNNSMSDDSMMRNQLDPAGSELLKNGLKLHFPEFEANPSLTDKIRAGVFQNPDRMYDAFAEVAFRAIFGSDVNPNQVINFAFDDGNVSLPFRLTQGTHLPIMQVMPINKVTGFESIGMGTMAMTQAVLSLFQFDSDAIIRFADLCSGLSDSSRIMAARFPNIMIDSVNSSPLQVKRGIQLNNEAVEFGIDTSRINMLTMDVNKYESNTPLDGVLIFEALLHLNREEMLHNVLNKHLAPGGQFVATDVGLTVPNSRDRSEIEEKYNATFMLNPNETAELMVRMGYVNVRTIDVTPHIHPFVHTIQKRMHAGLYNEYLDKHLTPIGRKQFIKNWDWFTQITQYWEYVIIKGEAPREV